MDFSDIIGWLKFTTKYVFAVVIASGVLLFLDETALQSIGLANFVNELRSWIEVIFWVFSILFILNIVVSLYIWMGKRYEAHLVANGRKYHLLNPSKEEKEVLLGYFMDEVKTQYFDITDSAVINLKTDNIIRSTNIWTGEKCAFEIQPWAWEYLRKHANRIFSREEIEKFLASREIEKKQKNF
jgi:hypothetical protein